MSGGGTGGGAPVDSLPPWLASCVLPPRDALRRRVTSGTRLASGFATAEPHSFYADLWRHVVEEEVTDLEIRQALFMAAHPLLVGPDLAAELEAAKSGADDAGGETAAAGGGSVLAALRRRVVALFEKAERLDSLLDHYGELRERRIRFVSGFMSPATNTIVPDTALLRMLHPDWAGRNLARSGIAFVQPVHFPHAPDALIAEADGTPGVDLLVLVATPPDADGQLSHGPGNGANAEALDFVLRHREMAALLYLNPRYPFTWGHPESPNTFPVEALREAAGEGRLTVVMDDAAPPALPAGAFDDPSEAERRIAEHVVNHMEMHPELTHGRALQVGIGGTGVQAVRRLAEASWRGRCYTEMLEPLTFRLFEAGKIEGSHFVAADGRRQALDGKMVATFSLGVEGDGFYRRLHRNPAVVLAAASRVVVPEAFYGGLGINNILGIDFLGHVNSSARDLNPYSGVGGGAMILRGLARGGVAYLCLKSTHHTPEGERRSSIFPFLPEGTQITLTGPDLMGTRGGARFFLVTEHGVAEINARSQDRFIRALLSVAHPDFRPELEKRAWETFRVQP